MPELLLSMPRRRSTSATRSSSGRSRSSAVASSARSTAFSASLRLDDRAQPREAAHAASQPHRPQRAHRTQAPSLFNLTCNFKQPGPACQPSWPLQGDLARRLGEALMHLQGEFQGGESTGGMRKAGLLGYAIPPQRASARPSNARAGASATVTTSAPSRPTSSLLRAGPGEVTAWMAAVPRPWPRSHAALLDRPGSRGCRSQSRRQPQAPRPEPPHRHS